MRKNRLNRFLELPKEIDNNIPRITILDFNEVLIENYKGILEYEEFYVRINTCLGDININGYNLELKEMTDDDIMIKGIINNIDIERNI